MPSRLVVTTASLFFVTGVAAAPRQAPDTDRVQSLAWLAGCWEAAGAARTVEEHWMAPRGGTMLGVSRTTQRKGASSATTEHEFLRIFVREGKLVYAALPSGQTGAEFTESALGEAEVVFSNSNHDFPQTIRYRRAGADSLHARVEGTMGGSTRGFDFRYRRVTCGVTPSS